MKQLILLTLLTVLIVACSEPQIIEDPVLPPNPNVDDVIAPIVDTPEPTLDAKNAFREIYNNPPTEYSVAYNSKQVANGQTQARSETIFVKGEKERNDIELIIDGLKYKERGIALGNKVIVCANPQTWECYELSIPEDAPKDKPDFDELVGDNEIRFSPDRLIVGTVTNCFMSAITVPGEGTLTSEECYTDDGIPLFSEIKGPQGTITKQAVSYATSVPDSAFEPPAKPGTEEEFIALLNQTAEN